ncbi:unnamed protein product [Diamesa tonsa]
MDDSVKRDIKGILLSVGKPCTLRELSKLYSEQIGQQIDYRAYGFASLEKCLSATPDVCKLQYFGSECYVDRVLTENTKHLDTMTKAISKRKNVIQRNRFMPNYCAPRPPTNYTANRFYPQPVNYHYPPPCYPPMQNQNYFQMNNNLNQDVRFVKCPPNMDRNNDFFKGIQDLRSVKSVSYPNNMSFQQRITGSQKMFPKKTILKQGPPLVSNKSIKKPPLMTAIRNVPTVVFNNTIDDDKDNGTKVNVEKDIKKMVEHTRSNIESHEQKDPTTRTTGPKSQFSKNSLENINSNSVPFALITNALNGLKIQMTEDNKKYDALELNKLKQDEPKTTSSGQREKPKLSDIDKEISALLPDDPIYLIEFPEIIQDCTYKIPCPLVRKTQANLHFELYISEVHSPTQFWFQYGEEHLEELMNYMKDFYTELRKDDLSISPKNAKPGLIVAAFLFSKWQRAEILEEVDENNQLLVFFFDYGTKERIGLKNLKYLLETFSKIPRKALRGCLHGIKPKDGDATWKIKTSLVLLGKIEDKRMFGRVVNHRKEDNVFELIVKESVSDRYSLSDILIKEGYADPAPTQRLTNGVLNKRYQDGEFEEISYKRDSPLIWRSLKEFNLTDSNEICKNSKQGPKFIVDERGFVCELSDLLTTGCCNIDSEKTKLYQCESCNTANCCQIYEYCVSCCNNPDKVPMLEKLISKANDRQSLLFSSISDQFSLCLSLCRTNSNIDKCHSFVIEYHPDTNINKFQIGE